MEDQKPLPVLDSFELRVLGALMEKSKTTPEYYPMTVNGLTAACNQKTSRKPVVQYDEQTVILTLDTLKRKGLVATATGGSSRAVKYKHNFALNYQLMPAELAVVCMLILRGSQTPGELNTNSGRLYEFDSLEEVQQVLEKLAGAGQPFEQVQSQYAKSKGGSGLGLAISRSLIRLHGGAMRIRSRENLGTVISLSIPDEA